MNAKEWGTPTLIFMAEAERLIHFESRILPGYKGCIAVVFLLLFATTETWAQGKPASAGTKASPGTTAKAGNQAITLRSIVQAGRLDDMRWPVFSDFRVLVESFYRSSNFTPAWVKDDRPTKRAR